MSKAKIKPAETPELPLGDPRKPKRVRAARKPAEMAKGEWEVPDLPEPEDEADSGKA